MVTVSSVSSTCHKKVGRFAATCRTCETKISASYVFIWVFFRTLKSAVTSATSKSAPVDKAMLEESEEDDSVGDDAAFVSSSGELHQATTDVFGGDEEEELDFEAVKRQNSDLVVRSREATPEVPDKAQDIQEGTSSRKDGKKYVRMPVYEYVPWKSRFKMDVYQAIVRPVNELFGPIPV